MRGNKRRAAVVATAANRPQPALNDAILDVLSTLHADSQVHRKGMRCCVECGATSTPQWREGPMGPKTLCNACGVRRQRLLRKQQAAIVGNAPTAPVAAVQARRRMIGRSALQATALLESDELRYGAPSGSEHSSDETEVAWAAATNPTKHSFLQPSCDRQQRGEEPQLQEDGAPLLGQHDVEESCNDDESAAYDLLFFAGVQCGGGGNQSAGGHGHGAGSTGWRSEAHHSHHLGHGHNTRRHAQPVRRSEDFYYDDEDEDEMGGDDGASCKRRRLAAPPPPPPPQQQPPVLMRRRAQHVIRPWLRPAGGAFCLPRCEDVAESELEVGKTSDDLNEHWYRGHTEDEQWKQEQKQQGGIAASGPQPPPSISGISGGSPPAYPAVAPVGTDGAPSVAFSALAHPLLSLSAALPVLPLSLPLPSSLSLPSSMTTKDVDILAKLQLDFQLACLQMHQANVACETISAVAAERRQEAASTHEQAAVASRQLASEVLALADRYRLRDVLAELHSATAAEGAVAAAASAAVTPRHASSASPLQPQREQQH